MRRIPVTAKIRSELVGADDLSMTAENVKIMTDGGLVTLRAAGIERLPGFPVWVDEWVHEDDLDISEGTPAWKAGFLRKNAAFPKLQKDLGELLREILKSA